MKLKTLICILATVATVPAHAITISQWTFETSLPTNAGPISPEIGTGTATAFHSDSAAVYSNPTGNGSAESWSATRWSVGDYWQFQLSTAGFESITLSWDQTSSGTGPRDFGLFYSTDGTAFTQFGATYAVLENAATPHGAWSATTYRSAYTFMRDLSLVSALSNDSSVFFRLTDLSTASVAGGTVATGGTSRVDNFTVNGNPVTASVPESSPGLAGLGCLMVVLAAASYYRGSGLVAHELTV